MAGQVSQEWQHSLMDCSPCNSCLLSTYLPCILFGRTASRLNNPADEVGSCNSDCMIFCALNALGASWLLTLMKRGQIREKFQIEGSGMKDCCAAFWCPCCALIQQDNEVKGRTSQNQGTVVTEGYQSIPEGMHMGKDQPGQ